MKILKNILKSEAGQALPMALVLLVLGGLLIVPMLSFMTTNLTANRMVDVKTSANYAADAGIQDALWKLGDGVDIFAGGDSYDLTENVNGMTVTVDKYQPTQQMVDGDLYTVRSTAYLNGESKAVIIAQAVAGSYEDYSWLFEQVITCDGDVTTKKTDIIYGGILCEGTFDDNADVRSGDVLENTPIELPPAQELIDYYKSTFEFDVEDSDNWYNSDTYTIQAGTDKDNPDMIPPIYRVGDLTIGGSGYGKLSGTIYVTGQFKTSPNTTIDLNGQTIFSEYDSDCDPVLGCNDLDAIYFAPWGTIFGPGCIIGIGNVNYQPHAGTGDQLIGVDPDPDTGEVTTLQDRFALYKFKTTLAGEMGSFQVKCSVPPEVPEAHIKVAVYDDDGSGGAPGTLLRAADYADNITVISSWNPINIEDYALVLNNWYWLAAISDYPVISKQTVSSTDLSRYKSQAFTGFSFVDNPTGLTTPHTEKYMFRGFSYSQEFIMLMSVCCKVNLQPGTSFYGCIVGDTTVNLQPHCLIQLVDYDEGDLNFPSIIGTTGPSEGGNSPPLLNYNIQQ